MPTRSVAAKLSQHEAICAERYLQINARLKRIEIIMIKSAGALLISALGILAALLIR